MTKSKKATKWRDDPLFRYHTGTPKLPPAMQELKDGVAHHDKYIAEAIEVEVRRWK